MGQGSDVSYSDLGNIEAWYHYILDYMGNIRMAVNRDGIIEQITHYYLYGPRSHRESIFMLSARRRGFSRGQVIGDISTNENLQKFKFEGKVLAAIEKIDNLRREDEPLGEGKGRTFGLDNYDIHARNYFAMAPMWDRVDKKAEDYYGISPYAYCEGDPVNLIDQSGESTQVVMMDSIHYMVLDGAFDDDNNIYVVAYNDNGELVRTGQIVGESLTQWSFYNSDTESWEIGSVIDLSDNTATSFMEKIENEGEDLLSYIGKARNGGEYDIKARGDAYRGMPAPMLGSAKNIASARDLGNYGAGYKAGSKGLSIAITFGGFTAYDCYKNDRTWIEPIGSRAPQWIGYKKGFSRYIKKQISL